MYQVQVGYQPIHGFRTVAVVQFAQLGTSMEAAIGSTGSDRGDSPRPAADTHEATCVAQEEHAAQAADPVFYHIPMLDYERSMLGAVKEQWSLSVEPIKDPDDVLLAEHMFHNWSWTFIVSSHMNNCLGEADPIEIQKSRHADRQQRYEKSLHSIANWIGNGRLRYRIQPLKDANAAFVSKLEDRPFSDVRFVAADEDTPYWAILIAMFKRYKSQSLFWLNAPARRHILRGRQEYLEWGLSHFDIWKYVRMFHQWSRRPNNPAKIMSLFQTQPYFGPLRRTMRHLYEDGSGIIQYSFQPGDDYDDEVPEDTVHILSWEPSGDEDYGEEEGWERAMTFLGQFNNMIHGNGVGLEIINGALTGPTQFHYAQLLMNTIIGSVVLSYHTITADESPTWTSGHIHRDFENIMISVPGSYVEVIPWEELTFNVDENELPEQVQMLVDFSGYGNDARIVTWDVAPEICKHFQFIAEEQVLHACNIVSLDQVHLHSTDGSHIFLMIPVASSFFAADPKHFWRLWNDSALTKDPSDGSIYVLTSLEGSRYRRIYADVDEQAALRHVRRLIDPTLDLETTQRNLMITLGSSYRPMHTTTLPLLDGNSLSNICHLGSGAFGSVYEAIWDRPASLNHEVASRLEVVIKRPHAHFESERALRLLKHELEISYAGLSGTVLGCTEFFGIITLPNKALEPSESDAGSSLCLVFEKANAGSAMAYISTSLVDRKWSAAIEGVRGIFAGLDTLHTRNIIHGDIHPGNVLVTRRDEGFNDIEAKVVLCDFGLGRLSTHGDATSRSVLTPVQGEVGSSPYKAPELSIGSPYTEAADIYAAGMFGKLSMIKSAMILDNTAPAKVPRRLWEICDRCTARNPSDRPSANEICHEIERLSTGDDDADDATHQLENLSVLFSHMPLAGLAASTNLQDPSYKNNSRFRSFSRSFSGLSRSRSMIF